MTRREIALRLVELGFQYRWYGYGSGRNHRFVLYRDGRVSGGGRSLSAVYNENLLPDLNDSTTMTCVTEFLLNLDHQEEELVHQLVAFGFLQMIQPISP